MKLGAAARRVRQLGRKAVRRALPKIGWHLRPVILMYHRIDEDCFDPWGLCVSPQLFDAQMVWLANNRTVLALDEFAQLHSDGRLPANAAAITFDDGYASVGAAAAPVLERLHLPATLFVPAEVIGNRTAFWWDELAEHIIGFSGMKLAVGGTDHQLGKPEPDEWNWSSNAPPRTRRQTLFWKIWAANRTRPIEEIDELIGNLERAGSPTSARAPLMTAEQVRSVNSSTFKVGSHALTHASLQKLPSGRKRQEICVSLERCEALTGERPTTFAYPFGDYDEETQSIVAECGFVCACTTEGDAVSPRAQRWRLPRIGVGNWTPELLERVLLEL
jgi:peptidoglycan/xylan/chitin deacetylase (PgdA/CDA1 family)